MRKAAKQILVCMLILALFCVACRIFVDSPLNLYVALPVSLRGDAAPEGIRVSSDPPGTVRAGEPEKRGDWLVVSLEPGEPGETDLYLTDESGALNSMHPLYVDRFHNIFNLGNGDFTGDWIMLTAVTLFWLLMSAIMLWHFFQAKGAAFYDYGTIYYAGFSLFALVTGLVMLNVTVSHMTRPQEYSMASAYTSISGASAQFMLLTTPLMLVFAAAMAVSNIALLRHMRFRVQNVLGLLVSSALVLGEAAGWFWLSRDFMGSELEGRIYSTVQNTYCTIFVYFQCMLTGAVICGIRAARHRPAPDKDFIIIHGCWFRQDGTLPPLLRGRADKALEFWRRQARETGRKARFIPSGGQGADETMPEAEAIRRYLLSEGIGDDLILPETRSKTTWENMVFSKAIAEETDPEGKVVFATSSYHVFRSGLLARQAGLSAEGIGGRTKWWFWPNAFMRETAGLLRKRWKQELLFLLLLNIFFGTLSMILY